MKDVLNMNSSKTIANDLGTHIADSVYKWVYDNHNDFIMILLTVLYHIDIHIHIDSTSSISRADSYATDPNL